MTIMQGVQNGYFSYCIWDTYIIQSVQKWVSCLVFWGNNYIYQYAGCPEWLFFIVNLGQLLHLVFQWKITHSFHTKCRLKTNTGNKSIGCHILEDNGYNYDDNEFKGYLAYIRTYTNLVWILHNSQASNLVQTVWFLL